MTNGAPARRGHAPARRQWRAGSPSRWTPGDNAEGNTPAYFVLLHGHFTGDEAPPGTALPTGRILTLTIDPQTNRSTDSGIEDRMPNLDAIGKPEPLPLNADATAADGPIRRTLPGREPCSGPYWPPQLCVVEAPYSRATLAGVQARLKRLMGKRPPPAKYGWITGAGGTGVRDSGQPTTFLQVLVETPRLRAFVRRLPHGLVVQAALHPVGND
jgi:hypothetical protein